MSAKLQWGLLLLMFLIAAAQSGATFVFQQMERRVDHLLEQTEKLSQVQAELAQVAAQAEPLLSLQEALFAELSAVEKKTGDMNELTQKLKVSNQRMRDHQREIDLREQQITRTLPGTLKLADDLLATSLNIKQSIGVLIAQADESYKVEHEVFKATRKRARGLGKIPDSMFAPKKE